MIPIVVATKPVHFISIDIAYLPLGASGYRYILTIGDIFSKYIEPLQNQTASVICNAILDNWIFRHGCPEVMLSDQASNVDGEVI